MASLLMIPCQHLLLKKLQRHCHRKAASNSIRSEKTSSFSFRSNANVPFHELPGVYHILTLSILPFYDIDGECNIYVNALFRLPLINTWMTSTEC